MMLKNRHIFFILLLTCNGAWSQQNQTHNDSLLIGSWRLHSRVYDDKEISYEQDYITYSFSKDKSFIRTYNNLRNEGRWAWDMNKNNEINYREFFLVSKNKKSRGVEIFEIIKLNKDSLIIAKQVGKKIEYLKYIKQ